MSLGRIGAMTESYGNPIKTQSAERVIAKPQEKRYAVQNTEKEQSKSAPSAIETNSAEGKKTREKPVLQDFTLEELSLSFYPEKSKDIIGTQSDIRSLDMQKAISDMKKDRILEDYQYFVGSMRDTAKPETVTQTEDGIVMTKTANPFL